MFNKFAYPVVKIFNSILSQNIITCLNITVYKDIAIHSSSRYWRLTQNITNSVSIQNVILYYIWSVQKGLGFFVLLDTQTIHKGTRRHIHEQGIRQITNTIIHKRES